MLYYSFIEFAIIYSVYFISHYLFGGKKKNLILCLQTIGYFVKNK